MVDGFSYELSDEPHRPGAQLRHATKAGVGSCFWWPRSTWSLSTADNLGARLNARHTVLIAAWRQIFAEAGGQVPDRNIERMLSNTHIPVPEGDTRRLDLVVPGLNVARGLPELVCSPAAPARPFVYPCTPIPCLQMFRTG